MVAACWCKLGCPGSATSRRTGTFRMGGICRPPGDPPPRASGENYRTANCTTPWLPKACCTHGNTDPQARKRRRPEHRKDGLTGMLKQGRQGATEVSPKGIGGGTEGAARRQREAFKEPA